MIEIISGTDCGSSATTPGDGSCHFGSVCLDSNGDPSPNGVSTDDICGCDAAASMVADPNTSGHCILGGPTGRFDHSTKFSRYFGHHLKNIQFFNDTSFERPNKNLLESGKIWGVESQ